jgi:sec-independent protein translocase protein TatA
MFDPSAPHIIILLIVVLILFGSKRLPGAATSIGKAMKNFKGEMKGMREDGDEKAESAQTAQTAQPSPVQQPVIQQLPPTVAPDATQQQLADMQRQLAELQRQNVAAGGPTRTDGAPLSDAQPNQQPF